MHETAASLLVVADATPLLYLARIAQLDIRARLYTRVVMPGPVWHELVDLKPSAEGVDAIRAAAWLEVDHGADSSPLTSALGEDLDAGEAAAIALALLRRADLLLIDDLDGRRRARDRGLTIRGTVGILVAARTSGLIPELRPVLEALVARGFYLDPGIAADALATVGE